MGKKLERKTPSRNAKSRTGSRTATRAVDSLRTDIWKHRERLRTGRVLSIDPSAVSTSSLPGYCFVDGGRVVEYGTLKLAPTGPLHLRLQKIHEKLHEMFPKVDLLVIEDVAVKPLRTKRGASASGKTYMNPRTIHSLAQAVGVFKCFVPPKTPVLLVSPLTWTSYKNRFKWKLEKGDFQDAIAMWNTVATILVELERRNG